MPRQRKSHMLRVTGLPRELSDENLKTVLQEALNENFAEGEGSQINADITIVPSCYESDTQRVALLQFHGAAPQDLRDLDPLEDWQVEMDGNDLSFGYHFFGFTQLYTPEENKPVDAE